MDSSLVVQTLQQISLIYDYVDTWKKNCVNYKKLFFVNEKDHFGCLYMVVGYLSTHAISSYSYEDIYII